jgi:hypothetical protein
VIALNKPPSKLFKLKPWVTVSDAAKYLANVCDEEVTEADILRFALDRYIQLSVYFVNRTDAKPCELVHFDNAKLSEALSKGIYPKELKWTESPSIKKEMLLLSLSIAEGVYLNFEDKIVSLDGVLDLPMIGGERLDIEYRYESLTGGAEVTLMSIDGAFVQGQDGIIYQLHENYDNNEYQAGSLAQLEEIRTIISNRNLSNEKAEELLEKHKEDRKKYIEMRDSRPWHENFFPAGGLPQDSVLVVRTDVLREFEQLINENDIEKKTVKPHGNTEHNAGKREQILGAALSVLARWSDECKNGAGKIEATKIRELIESKSYKFWQEDGEPPMSTGEIEKLIRKWLKKTGE